MDLKMNEMLTFPIEQVVTSVDIEHVDFYSHYMATKLADKHYRTNGYDVFRGSDFENNFVLYLNDGKSKRYLDDYTKIKIGRAKRSDDVILYCENIMRTIPERLIGTLLYLCRICSYVGGPGFPDLIVIKEGKYKLYYVLFDELQTNQKLFLLLAKVLGISVGIVEVATKQDDKILPIDPQSLLNEILTDSRSVSLMEGLDEAIEHEERKLGLNLSTNELAQIEDEIGWMRSEKAAKPFYIFRKWVLDGIISSEDLVENMKVVDDISKKLSKEFSEYETMLFADPEFNTLFPKKLDDAMRKKADIMQKKFAIGPSRSKALLRFVESR